MVVPKDAFLLESKTLRQSESGSEGECLVRVTSISNEKLGKFFIG